jgi:hypothetical protein
MLIHILVREKTVETRMRTGTLPVEKGGMVTRRCLFYLGNSASQDPLVVRLWLCQTQAAVGD